ncbi:DUF455 domain-containing protein [Xylariaceae sp. FL1272]|nr:DUF455 domain-containing protein [Xylariaceae sp. FL1272]
MAAKLPLSHDTALCIIPPDDTNIWQSLDSLRTIYDSAHGRWPPHINLIYPFVPTEALPSATESITSHLKSLAVEQSPLTIRLDAAGFFAHRHDNTIFVHDSDEVRVSRLKKLRKDILDVLEHADTEYRMHLTIGQSQDVDSAPHKFLLEKAGLLPEMEWTVDKLFILVRERMEIDGNAFSEMKTWGTIDLATCAPHPLDKPIPLYIKKTIAGTPESNSEASYARRPYTYSTEQRKWIVSRNATTEPSRDIFETISLASYNVLAEFEYPASRARYTIIVDNILQQSISADILVLQEVTDDFLSFICENSRLRQHYKFATHANPFQDDIDPLPSHLNTVVFSRLDFSWSWLPFSRRHKGSVIIRFKDIGKTAGDIFLPTILSTVHLTCGLADGSVTAKKQELKSILNHLSSTYPKNPWILAGDFNITTSSYTIESALKKKAIAPQTVTTLKGLETMLTEAGLIDTWLSARVQYGEESGFVHDLQHDTDVFEGEQGATFDPGANKLAAEIVGSGFNNRPQRYDRILVKSEDTCTISAFTSFGRKQGYLRDNSHNELSDQTPMLQLSYGSDHWGVKCSLKLKTADDEQPNHEVLMRISPVRVSPTLDVGTAEINDCLNEQGVLPSDADTIKRKEVLELLEAVVIENDHATERGSSAFVMIPVGSYGMGSWSPSSDIDCLVIGPISSKVFFALASQRIRKAVARGVKLLRRVNANSGTMLELDVFGIKVDLQYCPSSLIASTWPSAMMLPPTDPVFSLSTHILAKLKPVRDMYYIRRTIPDYATYRMAFHLIKQWAKQRGLYSAKFGLLGGIHIAVLLTRVCKLLSQNGENVPLASVLCTFFDTYASFNWGSELVFDPFFHKKLRYVRTAREPLAILGYHAPALNVAHNATKASVRTISEEFKRASALLSQHDTTWASFLSESRGYRDFLFAFKSYIKISVQFWGGSLAKGSGFVGWVESRTPMLLTDLSRRIPNIHARIWPARFVDGEVSEDKDDTESDYQGYYLIGLDRWEDPNDETMSREDRKVMFNSLQTALQKFETSIRGDEKYFDSSTSWMSASLVSQLEIGSSQLDHREWGEFTIGEDEDDEEEEEEEEELDVDEDDALEMHTKKSKSKKGVVAQLPIRPAYSGKFRSSADVINRLRWDQSMDSNDYIVGYEDRFLGVKERALDAWKSEQTDQEFIPQHRILYFKRVSDGEVVWDRKERIDKIFGSGVSSLDADG